MANLTAAVFAGKVKARIYESANMLVASLNPFLGF